MNEQKKRQLIKALAYDTDREEIKAEKDYYREMGYIK